VGFVVLVARGVVVGAVVAAWGAVVGVCTPSDGVVVADAGSVVAVDGTVVAVAGTLDDVVADETDLNKASTTVPGGCAGAVPGGRKAIEIRDSLPGRRVIGSPVWISGCLVENVGQ
jgi:hypothetical protein